MRLSVEKDDDSYAEFRKLLSEGKRIRVYLNGEEISRRCYMADEEGCVAKVAALNDHGLIYADSDGEVVTETISGEVKIEILDPKEA